MSTVSYNPRHRGSLGSYIIVGLIAGLIASFVIGIAMPVFFPEVAAYWVERGVQAGFLPGQYGPEDGSESEPSQGAMGPGVNGAKPGENAQGLQGPSGARATLAYSDGLYTAVYAAEKVGPAVVGVVNRAEVYDYFSRRSRIIDQGSGSGVLIDNRGHIVTNYHVVQNAAELVVVFTDQDETSIDIPAEVVGVDPATDLAVLKIDPSEVGRRLSPAAFGDSSLLKVAEPVMAIGNPVDMEFQRSVTVGVVSGLNRKITYGERTFRLIQTDAVINPGNSGGPLVNMKGEVVGINTMKIDLPRVEGMGFSIPSNTVKPIIEALISKGRVSRPWLGVGVIDKERAAFYYGIKFDKGLYVGEVVEGGPSSRAGVRIGDIIVTIGGKNVDSYADLRSVVEEKKVGDTVELNIVRNGKKITLRVTLGEMPAETS